MGVLMATDREIHMYGRYGKVTRYVTVYVGGQEHQHVVKLVCKDYKMNNKDALLFKRLMKGIVK